MGDVHMRGVIFLSLFRVDSIFLFVSLGRGKILTWDSSSYYSQLYIFGTIFPNDLVLFLLSFSIYFLIEDRDDSVSLLPLSPVFLF